MYRSRFAINGVNVDIPGVQWVNDEQKLHGIPEVTYASVTQPGRDGELFIPASRTVGAADWDMSVTITGTSYADFQNRLRALIGLVSGARSPLTITEYQGDESGSTIRTLQATGFCKGMTIDKPWSSTDHGADITLTFRIPSGVWLEGYNSPVSVSGLGNKTINAGGSAPQYNVTMMLTPSANSTELSISPSGPYNDSGLYFGGSVTSGTPITINLTEQTAMQGSKNLSHLLQLGSSAFHVPVNGVVNIAIFNNISSLTISSRKAWY